MSKYYKRKKSTDINYHSLNIKVAAPAPDTTINIQEQKRKIRDDVDHISAVTQNEVRKVWAHRCRKPHIIIIDAGAVMKGKKVTWLFSRVTQLSVLLWKMLSATVTSSLILNVKLYRWREV